MDLMPVIVTPDAISVPETVAPKVEAPKKKKPATKRAPKPKVPNAWMDYMGTHGPPMGGGAPSSAIIAASIAGEAPKADAAKREPTAYQKFMKEYFKEHKGSSMKDCGAAWKVKKGGS